MICCCCFPKSYDSASYDISLYIYIIFNSVCAYSFSCVIPEKSRFYFYIV